MKTIILFSLLSFPAFAGTSFISVQVTPPERSLDWTLPGTFFKSLIKSRFLLEQRPYGSVTAKVMCEKTPDMEYNIAAEPQSFDVLAPLLFQGQGLGYFYASHEGHLADNDEVNQITAKMNESADVRTLHISISEKQCQRILNFLKEFKEKKIADHWGLPHRPLMGEGATSASLIAGVLKVAGLLSDAELMEWEHVLYLPKKFSGSPLGDAYVGIFSVLGAEWGKPDEESFVLKFFDPVMIHKWIGQKTKKLDRQTLPVPQGHFWEQANDPYFSAGKH